MGKKLTLLATDLVTLYGALAFMLGVRYGADDFAAQWYLHVVPFSMLFVAWLFGFYIFNLYEPYVLRNSPAFRGRLFQAIVVGGFLSALFFYLVPYFGITPRANLVFFMAAFAMLAIGMRWLVNTLLASAQKKRVLFVGITDEALATAQLVEANPQFGYTVAGLARIGQSTLLLESLPNTPVVETLADTGRFIAEQEIDTVVISPAAFAMPDVIGLFFGSLAKKVDFLKLASFVEQLTGTVPLGAIDQAWFLDNTAEGSKRSLESGKRILDVVGALILGIPTLILLPFVAMATALSAPGPIFFRQQRTGRGGTPFSIVKFRTMRLNAEKGTGAVWASENDPRVTALGRFLRKTRIDELPQVWNILKGDMSLIGPRAERPEFDAQLAPQIPFYMERYLIKPGLSGWAQINYPYGASIADAKRKLEYDLYYLKHRSLMLDMDTILKTISISLRRAGR